jgi:hypothetical protein
MFLGTILQFALAPLLWSFWLTMFGLPHPLGRMLPPNALLGVSALLLAAQALDMAIAWIGVRRAGKEHLVSWTLALGFYFPLATLALYKALWEVVLCPFHWDKTVHGLDLPDSPEDAVTPPPAPWPRRAAAAS